MPLTLIRGDITKLEVDAIVNAANESLLGGDGVDGAIHRAAGPKLLQECRGLGGCKTGAAKITKGYDLPSDYVIHTVGPIWRGGGFGEEKLLRSCYINSLNLAKEHELSSIAFPLISAGVYGYPKEDATRIALETMESFLEEHEMEIYLVFFDPKMMIPSEAHYEEIRLYLDELQSMDEDLGKERRADFELQEALMHKSLCLEDYLEEKEDGFTQRLFTLIDASGMGDVEVYKRANIDRKLFSKIRNNPKYSPSKATVLAFAIALKLDLDETEDLLRRAGYALSLSSTFDLIIRYFIEKKIYNIYEINEALFSFHESLLGY